MSDRIGGNVRDDKKPSLYLACKLTGASTGHIDIIAKAIKGLKRNFDVLPFQYDFAKYCPTGARKDVLRLDLQKVEQAEYMVVILNDDVSDGRGMEVMHRMHQSLGQTYRTLVLHRTLLERVSPMYAGLPDRFPGVALQRFDEFSEIESIVWAWATTINMRPQASATGR